MAYPSPLPICPLYHMFHQSINTIINCAAARWIKKQASAKFKWWEQNLQKFPSHLPLKTTLKYSKKPLNPSWLEHIPKAESCQPEYMPGSPLITEIPLSSNLKSFCCYLPVFTAWWVPRKPCLTCAMLLQSTRGARESCLALSRCCWSNGNEVGWVEWGSLLGLHNPARELQVPPSFSQITLYPPAFSKWTKSRQLYQMG